MSCSPRKLLIGLSLLAILVAAVVHFHAAARRKEREEDGRPASAPPSSDAKAAGDPSRESGTSSADGAAPPRVSFVDCAAEAGITLANVSGSAAKNYILETTGAGAAFLDYDLDGDLDLYVVNGGTLEAMGPANTARDALYRNDGGRFGDVSAAAGIVESGWGGGCATADYDNDGYPDIYVTNYGPNVLYRNERNGTFRDRTAAAGVGDPGWSLGAAFFDMDRDGDLDLYVANYLRFSPDDPAVRSADCKWKGIPVMCGPRGFVGEADTLYRNEGDGTFRDVTRENLGSVTPYYGMGVTAGDLDGDGDDDVLVANDSQDNHFLVNDGRGSFQDRGLESGLALSGEGRAQAGMGIDLGDYDGDGDEDVVVTNFSDDYNTLYRNDGGGYFTDVSVAAGMERTRSSVGWGAAFVDYDNDGDLDLFFANGHVYPQVDGHDPMTSYRQRNLLFRNDGGLFTDVSGDSGPGLDLVLSGRGVAVGDFDNDGDLDLFIVNEGGPPTLLRNDGGNARNWFKVRLRGSRSNRDGIGARISLEAGGRTQVRQVRTNSGYCSSHDPRLHFGIGQATRVDRLAVLWPSGTRQEFGDLPANRLVTIEEGSALAEPETLVPELLARPAAASSGKVQTAVAPRVARASGHRLSPLDLREVDGLVQAGTRGILAGEYQEGIAAYERALERLPPWEAASRSPDALGFGDREKYRVYLASLYDNLGVALMRAERLGESVEAIQHGLELSPGNAQFHHNLGLSHFHARNYANAIAAFQAARASGQFREHLAYDLGRAFAAAGNCDAALTELQLALRELPAVDLKGRRADSWYYLGSCQLDRGESEAAANAFREVLALIPGHQKALYKLGIAWRRMGRVAAAARTEALFKARQEADEAVRSMKRSGGGDLAGRKRLVRLALESGLPDDAFIEMERVLAASPRDPAAHALLGEVYLAFQPADMPRAEAAFREVLKVKPGAAQALVGLGETCRRAGRQGEAENWFRKALEMDPDNREARVGMLQASFVLGRAAEATEGIERLLRERPADARILRSLAEIYTTPGVADRPEDALRLLDRTEARYGEGTETRCRALAWLGKLEDARLLVEESPFLGRAARERLLELLAEREGSREAGRR